MRMWKFHNFEKKWIFHIYQIFYFKRFHIVLFVMKWWNDIVRYHFRYLSLQIGHKIGRTHKNVKIHEFRYRSFSLLQTAITIISVEISICFFLEKKEMHVRVVLKQQYWIAESIWLRDGALKHPTPHVNRYDRT